MAASSRPSRGRLAARRPLSFFIGIAALAMAISAWCWPATLSGFQSHTSAISVVGLRHDLADRQEIQIAGHAASGTAGHAASGTAKDATAGTAASGTAEDVIDGYLRLVAQGALDAATPQAPATDRAADLTGTAPTVPGPRAPPHRLR